MKRQPQRSTLAKTVSLPAAIGTLSLRPVTVTLEPAEVGGGLQVRRTDSGQRWPVDLDHVLEQTNCTAVGDASGAVAFLEHLLAALWAGGISDVLITTDGPEIPLYDGSALALWRAVQEAGRCESAQPWEPLVITEPCDLLGEDRALLGLPCGDSETASVGVREAPRACYSYTLAHPHPLIGKQFAQFCSSEDFGSTVAPARTFATAEQLRATRGQEPGPQVEALCVVVYDDRLSEQSALSQPFARHKLLDLIGDLFLCGRPIQGAITAVKTGHRDNHEFLARLLRQTTGADMPVIGCDSLM